MLGAFAAILNDDVAALPLFVSLVMAAARVVGLFFLPLFAHFFLIFPERSPLLVRFPRLERWLYWPFALTLPWFAVTRLRTVWRTNEAWVRFFDGLWFMQQRWIALLALFIAIAYLMLGLAALLLSYRIAGTVSRRRLHVITLGSGAGMLNLLLMVLWETFFRTRWPDAGDWLQAALKFTLPLVPLSFAYAIVKHRVIPVSLIIRRGVRYVLVSRGSTLVEIAAVTLAVTGLLTVVFSRVHASGLVVGITSAAVGIGAWRLTSGLHDKYLAPLIDRRFFRQAYDAQQIIAELADSLRSTTSLPELCEQVATRLQAALQTASAAVLLRDEATGDYLSGAVCGYESNRGQAIVAAPQVRLPSYAATVATLRETGQPVDVEPELISSAQSAATELQALATMKAALLLPLTAKDGLVGIISLGARLGDVPFSRADKQLLASIAGPTTLALENARLVERMIAEARRREEAEAQNEQRAKELEEARQLQFSMLPKKIPQLPGLEIAAYMKTASEVGGDYYDFHLADDGALTIVVGDATGHGLKAGTVVTATKSLFNHLAATPAITDIFAHSSRALKMMNLRALYMAMAMVKLRGRQMSISLAGMPPVLHYRAATGEVEEVAIKGIPLGSMSGYVYRESEIELFEGDVVVLLSDGFPERFNDAGEMLGYDAPSAALLESFGGSPQQIVEHFVAVGEAWAQGRPTDDDITFVVIKVR